MRLISITSLLSTAYSYNCSSLNFLAKPYPRTAVTSFPGSGNTWFRHLMHMATGYHTGSVYEDGKLMDAGFQGEKLPWHSDDILGVKVHTMGKARKLVHGFDSDLTLDNAFPKAIMIIRSPYSALLSEFNRQNNPRHEHIGSAPIGMFRTDVWRKFIDVQSKRWGETILSWLYDYHGDLHVICYEDLKVDTTKIVTDAVRFISDDIRIRYECLGNEDADGQFKRAIKEKLSLQTHYSDEMISTMGKWVGKIKNALTAKGYQDCTKLF